jgi:hypothetical protein
MKIKTQQVALSKLHLNTGQIPGVPKNPRYIKDERFEALKKSIQDDPEMLELREIIAYDNNGELVIVGGNMRYRAMKELGFKDAPVKVLPQETAAEKIRAFIVKDNVVFGSNDWDILGNEWEVDELMDFGLECDFLKESEVDFDAVDEISEKNFETPKTEMLVCPKCSHQDFAIHFKKIKVDNIETGSLEDGLGESEVNEEESPF